MSSELTPAFKTKLRRVGFGCVLKSLREEAELSQKEVADCLGYASAQFVSNWERGTTLPPNEAIIGLAELFMFKTASLLAASFSTKRELLAAEEAVAIKALKKKTKAA